MLFYDILLDSVLTCFIPVYETVPIKLLILYDFICIKYEKKIQKFVLKQQTNFLCCILWDLSNYSYSSR